MSAFSFREVYSMAKHQVNIFTVNISYHVLLHTCGPGSGKTSIALLNVTKPYIYKLT